MSAEHDDAKRAAKILTQCELIQTGGGCEAWSLRGRRGRSFQITRQGDPSAPTSLNEAVTVVLVDNTGENVFHAVNYDTFEKALRSVPAAPGPDSIAYAAGMRALGLMLSGGWDYFAAASTRHEFDSMVRRTTAEHLQAMRESVDDEKPTATELLMRIQAILSGTEWSPDTIDEVADVLLENGYKLEDLNEGVA